MAHSPINRPIWSHWLAATLFRSGHIVMEAVGREVVAPQLEERSLQNPEIRGSNPVISYFYLLSIVLKLR